MDPEVADETEDEARDVRGELAACIAPLLERLPAIYGRPSA
jgi:hypothetical protein